VNSWERIFWAKNTLVLSERLREVQITFAPATKPKTFQEISKCVMLAEAWSKSSERLAGCFKTDFSWSYDLIHDVNSEVSHTGLQFLVFYLNKWRRDISKIIEYSSLSCTAVYRHLSNQQKNKDTRKRGSGFCS